MFTDLNACHQYDGGLDAAHKVTAETSLILGEMDRMTPPSSAQPLIDLLPGATVHRLAGCGHMMMAEQPEETLQAMKTALGNR